MTQIKLGGKLSITPKDPVCNKEQVKIKQNNDDDNNHHHNKNKNKKEKGKSCSY